ncbi:metallophosphoesterase [Vogesella sp. EB]|uniref:metallophosphoesterase family protein n=1 Tax=Vogesella sp. EB TaxID=1526735 RepID=UPI001EE4DB0D|nr:metallophosphatase family protein [Vogesella sp. EB]
MLPDRFAVISDIHGNLPALQAVLADMHGRGVSHAVNLGETSCPARCGRRKPLTC